MMLMFEGGMWGARNLLPSSQTRDVLLLVTTCDLRQGFTAEQNRDHGAAGQDGEGATTRFSTGVLQRRVGFQR